MSSALQQSSEQVAGTESLLQTRLLPKSTGSATPLLAPNVQREGA